MVAVAMYRNLLVEMQHCEKLIGCYLIEYVIGTYYNMTEPLAESKHIRLQELSAWMFINCNDR